MYTVKVTPYRKALGGIMHRQTKGDACVSLDGRYRFFIDEEIESPDFWIVQGKGLRQPQVCNVAPENTVLLTTEPRSILVYPDRYIRQFGMVCTCQERTRHPNTVFGPAILPWFVGYKPNSAGGYDYTQSYDTLKGAPLPPKQKLLSVITSNKAFTAGHIKRIDFVRRLKEYYGERLDVFGRGFRDFDDKWDVLSPYKYHIVIENSSQDYYWTEKLSDCFLCGTYPLYYGCRNVTDYFPAESMALIDIDDFGKTVETIDRVIAADTYSQAQTALMQSKNLVLDKFNMFEYIAALCDTLNPDAPKKDVRLVPCRSTDDVHNLWNYTVARTYYNLKMKAINLFHGRSL